MSFLDLLKTVEPTVSTIAKDAGITRQAAYTWNHAFPQEATFKRLLNQEKYKYLLSNIDYQEERKKQPIGRSRKKTRS